MLNKNHCLPILNWPLSLCGNNVYATLLLMHVLYLKEGGESLVTLSQLQQVTRRLLYVFPSSVLEEAIDYLCELRVLEPEKAAYRIVEDTLSRHIQECMQDVEYMAEESK